jgi:hypothetical protein
MLRSLLQRGKRQTNPRTRERSMQMSPLSLMFHTSPITRACARVALAESRAFARFSFNLVVSISFAFALTCAISLVVRLSPAISTGSGTFGDERNKKPWNSMQEQKNNSIRQTRDLFPGLLQPGLDGVQMAKEARHMNNASTVSGKK